MKESIKHLTMDDKKKVWIECTCDIGKDHYHSKKELEKKPEIEEE